MGDQATGRRHRHYDTRHSIHLTEKAHELGVDAFLIVTPSTRSRRSADRGALRGGGRSDGPAGGRLQLPSRVVIDIEPETISRLAQIENVRAVKQAYDDLAEAKHIVETA